MAIHVDRILRRGSRTTVHSGERVEFVYATFEGEILEMPSSGVVRIQRADGHVMAVDVDRILRIKSYTLSEKDKITLTILCSDIPRNDAGLDELEQLPLVAEEEIRAHGGSLLTLSSLKGRGLAEYDRGLGAWRVTDEGWEAAIQHGIYEET